MQYRQNCFMIFKPRNWKKMTTDDFPHSICYNKSVKKVLGFAKYDYMSGILIVDHYLILTA